MFIHLYLTMYHLFLKLFYIFSNLFYLYILWYKVLTLLQVPTCHRFTAWALILYINMNMITKTLHDLTYLATIVFICMFFSPNKIYIRYCNCISMIFHPLPNNMYTFYLRNVIVVLLTILKKVLNLKPFRYKLFSL